MRMGRALLAALLVALPMAAGAQTDAPSRNAQNEGNDPLTPKAAIDLQDYVQPILNGQPGSGANQGIVRGLLPHDALGWPQIMRASLPVVDTAYGPTGSITGLGDLTVYDVPLIFIDKAKFGVGPLLVAPTSTSRALGDGKWQGGAQAVASAPHDWGLTRRPRLLPEGFRRRRRTDQRPAPALLQSRRWLLPALERARGIRSREAHVGHPGRAGPGARLSAVERRG